MSFKNNEKRKGDRISFCLTPFAQSKYSDIQFKERKLFCAFIDFEKAFDEVWRLFYKMMLNNINGKMYNVIINMYGSIKSCISYNNCISEYFDCANGVRQKEILSPFLFSLFQN
jgi:hypothetical protein